tara:strand:+ start:320 stop:613 length:294 start_codon:yes stop_codon:yes gene_type:complete
MKDPNNINTLDDVKLAVIQLQQSLLQHKIKHNELIKAFQQKSGNLTELLDKEISALHHVLDEEVDFHLVRNTLNNLRRIIYAYNNTIQDMKTFDENE